MHVIPWDEYLLHVAYRHSSMKILLALQTGYGTVRDISVATSLSREEIRRSLEQLTECNFVTKHGSHYSLTPLAEIALHIFTKFDRLLALKDFIINHDLTVIPRERLDALLCAEQVFGVMEIFMHLERIIVSQTGRLFIALRGFTSVSELLRRSFMADKQIRILVHQDELNANVISLFRELNVEYRICNRFKLATVVNDKEAILFLRDRENGDVKYSWALYGQGAFRELCEECFNNLWMISKPSFICEDVMVNER